MVLHLYRWYSIDIAAVLFSFRGFFVKLKAKEQSLANLWAEQQTIFLGQPGGRLAPKKLFAAQPNTNKFAKLIFPKRIFET